MADLIFRDELNLMDIAEGDIGEAIIAYYRANPGKLSSKDRAAIAKFALMQDQANKAIEKADAAEQAAKFEKWTQLFFESRKSKRTRAVYEAALERLKAFCEGRGIELSQIEYADAVDFTLSDELKQGKRGARGGQSIRLDIAAVSSLYSELERLSKGKIRNPFLRLQTKPCKKRDGDKAVPTETELETILANTSGQVRAAIAVMAYRGLRIGALPELELATRSGKTAFNAFTKGKAQAGVMPKEAMEAIEAAGLNRKKPFADVSVDTLKMRIQRELDRLAGKGLIAGQAVTRKIHGKPKAVTVSDYSCHSFRHFYAVTEYERDHDINRVRKLLNHADLNTTQVYLQSLGLLEE